MTGTQPTHCIFVYGTLRRGEPNSYLLEGAEYVGEAETADDVYQMSGSGVPFVWISPDQGRRVRGEVFRVSDRTRERLDRLEGHPKWYCRTLRGFKLIETGEEIYAEVYLIQSRAGPGDTNLLKTDNNTVWFEANRLGNR